MRGFRTGTGDAAMKSALREAVFLIKDIGNALAARIDGLSTVQAGELRFRCNICGRMARAEVSHLTREEPTCRCGSSVRLRSLVHLLTTALFGESLAIPDIPLRKDLTGVDMSGAATYAGRLARRLGYINTFLHQEPRLDILAPADQWLSQCDFVISSDVFEHVLPPVAAAFDNTLQLLKPGGVFVFTVPWIKTGPTVEHFPALHDYHLEQRGETRILVNRTVDGLRQEFNNPVFHGGEGQTLEMRVFSESGILGNLAEAGFCDIRIHGTACPTFGIIWQQPWSLPMTARRPGE